MLGGAFSPLPDTMIVSCVMHRTCAPNPHQILESTNGLKAVIQFSANIKR
jgi:hypothetical protein